MLNGFTVDLAEDGLSALRRIDEQRPDLIVLDLHLPCVHGLEVLNDLRGNTSTFDVPVVVVTGADDRYPVAQASAILSKPCDPEKLIEVIERQLAAAA